MATHLVPEKSWYLSALARQLDCSPSRLQRELTSLSDAGILTRWQEGNRVYYRANPDCPIFRELQSLVIKTAGLVDVLSDALAPFAGRIQWAFVYGSIARGEEVSTSDIDLLIIGQVGLADVAPALRTVQQRLGRPVNPVLYHRAEVAKKLHRGHHFLSTVFHQDKLFIQGSEHELAAAFEQPAPTAAPNKSARARRIMGHS